MRQKGRKQTNKKYDPPVSAQLPFLYRIREIWGIICLKFLYVYLSAHVKSVGIKLERLSSSDRNVSPRSHYWLQMLRQTHQVQIKVKQTLLFARPTCFQEQTKKRHAV